MSDRRGIRVALVVLALIGAVLATLTTPAEAAPSPSSPATGKYYVVAAVAGGQRESLYEIAARTLGDGDRSREILSLNEGRPQADGGRLTDPLVLTPGWILILPSDARGSGVHSGPLPTASLSLAPSAATSALPSQNTMVLFGGVFVAFMLLVAAVAVLQGGRRGTGGRVGSPGPDRSGGDAGPPPSWRDDYRGDVVVTNGVAETVGLPRVPANSGPARPGGSAPEPRGPVSPVARPGIPDRSGPGARPGQGAVPSSAAGPGAAARAGAPARALPPARSGPPIRLAAQDWPAPGDRRPPGDSRSGADYRPSGDGHAGDGRSRAEQPDKRQAPRPPEDPKQAERRPDDQRIDGRRPVHGADRSDNEGDGPGNNGIGPDDSASSADRERPGEVGPGPAARPNDSPAPRNRPEELDVSRSSEDSDAVRPVEVSEPGAVVEGETHAQEDGPGHDLVAELVADGGRVAVSLVGATGEGPGIAYGWRSAGQAPPVATLPVVLGDRDGRHLHLDLGRCPDVLTVAGSLPDCEKYALRLVRQVLTNGHGVAVIGDGLFGDALPAGCRRVATMADIRGLDSPGIVVCGRLTGPDIAAARLSRASGGPTPVIIGDVARSRWTLRVNPA